MIAYCPKSNYPLPCNFGESFSSAKDILDATWLASHSRVLPSAAGTLVGGQQPTCEPGAPMSSAGPRLLPLHAN
jgi:hypothetical protein